MPHCFTIALARFAWLETSGFTNHNAVAPGYQFSLKPYGNDLALTYSPVPEPSTIAMLFGAGLVGLGGMWRRRKRRHRKTTPGGNNRPALAGLGNRRW